MKLSKTKKKECQSKIWLISTNTELDENYNADETGLLFKAQATKALGKTLLSYYFTMGLKFSYKNYFYLFLCTFSLHICTCHRFFEKLLFLEINACKSSTNLLALLFCGVNKFTLLLDGVKQGPKIHNVHTELIEKIKIKFLYLELFSNSIFLRFNLNYPLRLV